MPDPRAVPGAVARRFLVLRHLLAPPRSLPPEPESVLAVVDRIGSLQFDPLAVAGRNHDLVLHARVAAYRPAWTDELLYGRRLLFEALNKGLSILPARELPWYRHTWDRRALAHEDGLFAEHAETVEAILERIRGEGPLTSLDFDGEPAIDWYWAPTSRARAVLEALSEVGILGLARREGNRRYYDLMERLQPAELLEQRVPEVEQVRHRLLSRYRGHGLLGTVGRGELWSGTVPAKAGTARSPGQSREEVVAALVERGELTPVEVEGVRGMRYVVTDELPLLGQAEREVAAQGGAELPVGRRPRLVVATDARSATDAEPEERPGGAGPGVAFIAPLDPFVWDRDLTRTLFGFDYTWEVYVPAAKRRFGYYVLPVLFGDRLAGRIEPRIDRAARKIRVLGAWWEPGFEPLEQPGFLPALAAALDAYRHFAGATAVTWPRTRAARSLAGALKRLGG